jgi:hypothetical protein
MRRTLPAVALGLATIVGLATPALAEDTTTTTPSTRPARTEQAIHLSCHEVTVDDSKPAIHCEWDAFEGAAGYRVVATVRRGAKGSFVIRRTEATSFTRKDVKPGHYNFVVQALGEDKKPVARSNREQVVVERAARNAA